MRRTDQEILWEGRGYVRWKKGAQKSLINCHDPGVLTMLIVKDHVPCPLKTKVGDLMVKMG